jgi:hypothetical protein
MIFASNAVPNYGLKFTMPQILKNSKLRRRNTSSRTDLRQQWASLRRPPSS